MWYLLLGDDIDNAIRAFLRAVGNLPKGTENSIKSMLDPIRLAGED